MPVMINKRNYKKEIRRCKTPVLLCFSGGLNVMSFLSDELEAKIKVGVVDSAQNAELVKAYEIVVFPTAVLIKNNAVTDKIVGNLNDYLIRNLLT